MLTMPTKSPNIRQTAWQTDRNEQDTIKVKNIAAGVYGATNRDNPAS